MLILAAVDWDERRADYFASGDGDVQADLERVRITARRVGGWTIRQVDGPESAPALRGHPPANAIATLLAPCVHHHVERLASGWRYHAIIEHDFTQLEALSTWSALALAGYGPQEDHLTQLHVALYEISANILEHGRPLGQPARLELTLDLGEGEIQGRVADHCEYFDSCGRPAQDLDDLLRRRRRRGYGLAMIQSLLDECRHGYQNDEGNRLTFRKEVRR